MRNIFFIFIFFISANATAQQDIVWTIPSVNSEASMPCGGGDIGMNVWVENGDLLIYIARSGSFNEQNAMLKAGRLRIRTIPSILDAADFRQQLHLYDGYLTITASRVGRTFRCRIWADVEQPVVHLELNGNKGFQVEAAYESWRYCDKVVAAREHFGNSYKWTAPKAEVYRRDSIEFDGNAVQFVHHNQGRTIFDVTVAQQGLDSVKHLMYDPLRNLASGGRFEGSGFIPAGLRDGDYAGTRYRSWVLYTPKPSSSHRLKLSLHNTQTADISTWRMGLDSLKAVSADARRSADRCARWWRDFWQRSHITIGPKVSDSLPWRVARNYRLFRYMLGCNARGDWPTKFNGGLFTVDPVHTNNLTLTPDFRNWGGGLHTMQNQRLLYYPMIRSGDWDLMQSQFRFYQRILPTAELRSRIYWGHDGACFTEQMENFGLPNYAEYGTKRPARAIPGVEYNAWLEYQWDSALEFCLMMLEEAAYTGRDIRDRVPFILSILRFFDEHYRQEAGRRGIRELDGAGKLIIFPGSAAETFKMAHNPSSTIAGLRVVSERLLAEPMARLDSTQQRWLQDLKSRIPEIPYRSVNGHQTIAPALSWERINNTESPQLYPVFPWGIFGLGRPGLDTALATWHFDTSVIKFRSHIGWKQDNIWAARLGLTSEAWRLTALKLDDGGRRFPAFWGPGFDWVPDHNHGGSGMIGLQEMLLQTDGRRIMLFPAWPKDLDVSFRLHAPGNTVIDAELRGRQVTKLIVTPAERIKDVQSFIPLRDGRN
jgi:hypothetical protein